MRMSIVVNDSSKKFTPLMAVTLAAGNFLFVLGIVFSVIFYMEVQDRMHAGQFAKTWGLDVIYPHFPNLEPTELSICMSCGAFAISAVFYQASVLMLIFLNQPKGESC
jgi:hypothetical protein